MNEREYRAALDELKERVRLRDETIKVLLEERAKALAVVREQGQFIERMKQSIREFRNHPPVSLGRPIADRGFRAGS